jgi:hypothetical protein
MKNIFKYNSRKDAVKSLMAAFIVTTLVFSSVVYAIQVNASTVTLTATVATSLTFTTSTNQFSTIAPGTPGWATTTLDVLTNDTSGWNVGLTGDNKSTGNNNLQLAGNSASIQDQTEWVPGSATTTTGNAAIVASLVNSGNVLAFRVMTASSSNGTAFVSTNWWGTDDQVANAKYGGIASSTAANTKIGNAGSGSYSASDHLNTVVYRLNVSASQQTGAYSAPLTYTAVGN